MQSVEDGNPFTNLFESISKFGTMGDIIILGDFNARTKDLQTPQYDCGSNLICTIKRDPTNMGLQRLSEDHSGPLTCYGRHLLQLCESSDLVILNGLSCFSSSEFFTCGPQSGGASVVDCILIVASFLPSIHNFTISYLPLADHALLSLSVHVSSHPLPPITSQPTQIHPHTRFYFEDSDQDLFIFYLRRFLCPASFTDHSQVSTMFHSLATTNWESALISIPHHSILNTPKSIRWNTCPINQWFDDTYKTFHRSLHLAFDTHSPAFTNLRLSYKRFLRHKKRLFIASQGRSLCDTLIRYPKLLSHIMFPDVANPSLPPTFASLPPMFPR